MNVYEYSPLYVGDHEVSENTRFVTTNKVFDYLNKSRLNSPDVEVVKTTYKSDENFLETANLVELEKEIISCSAMFLTHIGYYEDFRIVSWLNVFEHNAMEQEHYHFSALMSGTYYVDCEPDEQSGCFVIPDQIPQREQYRISNKLNIIDHHKITPYPGRLILFESWVRHGVYPNKTYRPRISIAFNIEKPACL